MYFGYFHSPPADWRPISPGATEIIKDVVEAVSLAVVIIVCAVPEGLPLMISLVLMQNTSKMLDHNVLVRKAEGIETAGSLNILFSDKTGTITKGQLEVVEFFTADGITIPLDSWPSTGKIKGLVDLAIGKNTQSMFDAEGRVIGGNATDQALMKFLGPEPFGKLESSCTADPSQSFNSANKFSQAHIRGAGQDLLQGRAGAAAGRGHHVPQPDGERAPHPPGGPQRQDRRAGQQVHAGAGLRVLHPGS